MMAFDALLPDENENMFVYGHVDDGRVVLGTAGDDADVVIVVPGSRLSRWRADVIAGFFGSVSGERPRMRVQDVAPDGDFSGMAVFIDDRAGFEAFCPEWDRSSGVTGAGMPVMHVFSNPVGIARMRRNTRENWEMERAHLHNQLVDAWERCRKMIPGDVEKTF